MRLEHSVKIRDIESLQEEELIMSNLIIILKIILQGLSFKVIYHIKFLEDLI